ncbi:MAG: SUMF1/EgtB/PvdO family nonheme iron enzyme [Deltaproteobacteria bacterium]|nr:SUMF1/EgtB/PvdO family nonheme iron enzyme [Deltaproteobacteria bacterium]
MMRIFLALILLLTSCAVQVQPDLESLDQDKDGFIDDIDHFPLNMNEWEDADQDGIGNNADTDDDGDGCLDSADEFPLNPLECVDTDQDKIGNNTDTDDDGDGILDAVDDEPLNVNTPDQDGDGTPDSADSDKDGDGCLNANDAFTTNASECLDTDSDGIGNNADTDDDGDGVADGSDAFPLNSSESLDTDGDGVGNNSDTNDDGDACLDSVDGLPLSSTECLDTDGDGTGNNADADDDGDGCADGSDVLPLSSSECLDTDSDGVGNNTDTDDDGDGCTDGSDDWPLISTLCNDNDLDGVENGNDAFPNDATETADTDADGVGNNEDCNDGNANVSTDHHEICGNSVNDDCDGSTDEIGCVLQIVGGTFNMGDDSDGDGEGSLTSQVHDVTLSTFYLDKHEVTNALYKACVDASSCTAPSSSNLTYGVSAYNKLPIVFVNWTQASQYCTYAGKRLPTESEWEYAARNGATESTYAWGSSAPTTTLANYFDGTTFGFLQDVDQYSAGASTAGVFNLQGNASEWVFDFAGNYALTTDSTVTNPTGPASGQITTKIYRGGNFTTLSGLLQSKDRFAIDPATQSQVLGFRCASSTATKN